MGAACHSKTRGRCLATLLAIRVPGHDPAQSFARGTFALWLQQWLDHPEVRPAVRRAWSRVCAKLQAVDPVRRSRHIRGPV
eukprot:8332568-Pyramimonas_sp.AAC.1